MISSSPAHPPQLLWAPSPATPFTTDVLAYLPPPSKQQQQQQPQPQPQPQPIDFSPPLIAMVVIAAAAFLIVTYSRLLSRHFLPPLLRQFRRYRRWRRRRQLLLPSSVDGSVVMDSPPYVVDVYGLDDSVIKSMPLSVYSSDKSKGGPIDEFQFPGDCAVCLLEFVDNDYVRTLPLCVHSFHVDCIDVWLRSHASCPLCRAGVLPREWPTSLSPVPLVPVMASRIRPSLDEGLLLDSIFLDPLPARSRRRSDSVATVPEIVPAQTENEAAPEAWPGMLKRSYSFGFERNFSSDRLVMEPATASPWRHRLHHHNRRGSLSFWRRPSPFSTLAKHHRVFSFRSNRGSIKSPFSGRRRGVGEGGLAPLSESACIRYTYYHSSSRGSKSMATAMVSPMFGRSSASSRMRCGDPEALISPERYREP